MKVKIRETTEVIIGAVTESLERPDTIVVGRPGRRGAHDRRQETPLSTSPARLLAAVLTPAGADHPWTDEVSSSRSGSSRAKLVLTKVEPVTVAEVLADTAQQAGAFRHPVRFVRHVGRTSPPGIWHPRSRSAGRLRP